jgi:uncharacterized membrane protein (DUF4010 family)
VFLGFLLSSILWGLIGIDKDIGKKILPQSRVTTDFKFGSIRSFSLIAIFGSMMTWVDRIIGTEYIFILCGLLLIAFIVGAQYIYSVFENAEISPATEFIALLTYFVWVLVFLGYYQVSIIFAIILTFYISSKELLESLGTRFCKEELKTTLKFAVIAFVILPLLPDQRFSMVDIFSFIAGGTDLKLSYQLLNFDFFNPYSIWFFVVVMSGISYFWYILSKFVGKNSSILLSSFLGGMVSSTAVTASMTQKSKEDIANTNSYVMWVLLASCIMFFRVFLIVFFVNFALFQTIIIPGFAMFGTFLTITLFFYFQTKKTKNLGVQNENIRSPFEIIPALQFAALIVCIKFISGVWIVYKDIWGENLFYSAFGIISGLADVDAITQTMSSDAERGLISLSIAASTILLAVMSNNFVKGSIAWRFGEKSFGKKVMGTFVTSILVGIFAIALTSTF